VITTDIFSEKKKTTAQSGKKYLGEGGGGKKGKDSKKTVDQLTFIMERPT